METLFVRDTKEKAEASVTTRIHSWDSRVLPADLCFCPPFRNPFTSSVHGRSLTSTHGTSTGTVGVSGRSKRVGHVDGGRQCVLSKVTRRSSRFRSDPMSRTKKELVPGCLGRSSREGRPISGASFRDCGVGIHELDRGTVS